VRYGVCPRVTVSVLFVRDDTLIGSPAIWNDKAPAAGNEDPLSTSKDVTDELISAAKVEALLQPIMS